MKLFEMIDILVQWRRPPKTETVLGQPHNTQTDKQTHLCSFLTWSAGGRVWQLGTNGTADLSTEQGWKWREEGGWRKMKTYIFVSSCSLQDSLMNYLWPHRNIISWVDGWVLWFPINYCYWQTVNVNGHIVSCSLCGCHNTMILYNSI